MIRRILLTSLFFSCTICFARPPDSRCLPTFVILCLLHPPRDSHPHKGWQGQSTCNDLVTLEVGPTSDMVEKGPPIPEDWVGKQRCLAVGAAAAKSGVHGDGNSGQG